MANGKLTLQEFSLALLAGLASKGVTEIDFSRKPQITVAFYMAYKKVEAKVGHGQLAFSVRDPDRSDFRDMVNTIEEQWRSGLFTERIRSSRHYRLVMRSATQLDLMNRTIGGEAASKEAADAFMVHYEDPM